MLYWVISEGKLSTKVKEVCISQDFIVLTRKTHFLADNNAVMKECDYAKTLNEQFDM